MRLRWTSRAGRDLIEIARFVARDNRPAAHRLITSLRRRARLAALHARAGRVVPEIGRTEVREVILGNYRIVYRVDDDAITVLTVFEGHRLLPLADP